ncbi:MAG: hypothetical protein ACK5MD_03370 [Flavobacteriales bacterium]
MLRNIIGIIVGLMVASLFLTAILFIGWSLYPLPDRVEFLRPETYKHLDRNIYPGTYIFEILSYIISTFFGGMAVALVVKLAKPAYATLIGIIFFFSVLAKFILIPHPTWFNIVAVLPILPMGYFGGKLVDSITKRDKENT